MAAQRKSRATAKTSVKKRTLNTPSAQKHLAAGDPFTDLDLKRRLGNFTSTGEHSRIGGRTTGIVGQTKKKFGIDKKLKK